MSAAGLMCPIRAAAFAEMPVVLGAMATLLLAATVADVLRHRLPNSLVVPGAAIGIGLQWLLPSGSIWMGFAGVGVGLLLMAPLYWLRALAAGDVKLLGMVGAFLGPIGVAMAALCSFIAGGALALAFAATRRSLGQLFANLRAMTVGTWFNQIVGIREAVAPVESVGKLPYGVAIASGTIAYLLLHYGGVLP